MRIIFKESAARDLDKLDFSAKLRILKKLEFYSSQKKPLKFAESLTDSRYGNWRFRIGDYRTLFDVENQKIIILKVGHRKDIYRDC